jgi:hypothetical protein
MTIPRGDFAQPDTEAAQVTEDVDIHFGAPTIDRVRHVAQLRGRSGAEHLVNERYSD